MVGLLSRFEPTDKEGYNLLKACHISISALKYSQTDAHYILPKNNRLASCRQHPWFTMHLPRYLAVMQADTIANAGIVDQEVVEEVARLGFDRDFVASSIKDRVQNKVSFP